MLLFNCFQLIGQKAESHYASVAFTNSFQNSNRSGN